LTAADLAKLPQCTICASSHGVEKNGILLIEHGHASELRAVNDRNYRRVWDADIVEMLVDRFCDGMASRAMARAGQVRPTGDGPEGEHDAVCQLLERQKSSRS
jgi:hypothetical protein